MKDHPFLQAAHVNRLLQSRYGADATVCQLRAYPIDNSASILVTLTSQQTDSVMGHFGLELSWQAQGQLHTAPLVLKVKPHGREIADMLAGLAQLSDAALGAAYAPHSHNTGFYQTHVREIEVYKHLPHAIQPQIAGYLLEPETDTYQLLMQDLTGFAQLNSVMAVHSWTNSQIERALSDLAAWHAFARNQLQPLSAAAWADTDHPHYWQQEAPLWQVLLDKGAARFADCYAPQLPEVLAAGLKQIEALQARFNEMPKTLIHNDANPRNSCFRADGSFCLYDWELSCRHVPVYDVIELLSFVLEPDRYPLIGHFLQHYRRQLCRLWAVWEADELWQNALELAWYAFGWHRLGMYTMAHAVAPYPFLPRVWQAYGALGKHIKLLD
ncbi:MAG: hypothetical protein C0424_01510 [Sphingobacteriaceae bacterium]|nr:hypothetical protein [Sphingobacteriaceae bacterium]